MQIVTISEAQKMSSPNPFGLISVKKENGDTNLMAVSWWTYTSNHPASIAVCLNNKTGSGNGSDRAHKRAPAHPAGNAGHGLSGAPKTQSGQIGRRQHP